MWKPWLYASLEPPPKKEWFPEGKRHCVELNDKNEQERGTRRQEGNQKEKDKKKEEMEKKEYVKKQTKREKVLRKNIRRGSKGRGRIRIVFSELEELADEMEDVSWARLMLIQDVLSSVLLVRKPNLVFLKIIAEYNR